MKFVSEVPFFVSCTIILTCEKKIAEKPNVNTLNSVLSGLVGGMYYSKKYNFTLIILSLGLAGLAVGHPFGMI